MPVAKVPGFRLLAVATVMLYLVPSLFLLVMPVPSHGWSRPLWYQVGLDLQPWGCQPNSLDGCKSSLGCPGYWMGLGGSRIYPVAGVTITTTMLLVISRVILHRWRAKVAKEQVSTALLCPLEFLLLLVAPGPRPSIQPFSYQPGLGPVGFLPDLVLIPVSCSCISTEPVSTTNPSVSFLRASTLVHLSPLNIPILHPATMGPWTPSLWRSSDPFPCLPILFATIPYPFSLAPLLHPLALLHSHAGPMFQLPEVTSSSCKHWKRQPIVSDRTLVLRVLHMLDAILLHIEGHLQRLASQQQIQIKGSTTQTG